MVLLWPVNVAVAEAELPEVELGGIVVHFCHGPPLVET